MKKGICAMALLLTGAPALADVPASRGTDGLMAALPVAIALIVACVVLWRVLRRRKK